MKHWLQAFRLRTLPLALSVIFMGTCLAANNGAMHWGVFGLAVLTTIFLQILSNLANDYGDTQHGADSEHRVGPKRSVQTGAISPQAMLKAMGIFAGLSLISGLLLIWVALGGKTWLYGAVFLLLGLASIAAAIKYTAGSNPYGYRGLGDVFVFIFFGLVGVCGSYYLYTNSFDYTILLPAASMGLLSTGVLNLNNMRDIVSDEKAGKITIPVRLGIQKARIYHSLLIVLPIILTSAFVAIHLTHYANFCFLIVLPLLIRHLRAVWKVNDTQLLDPELKKLALTTLLFALSFGLGMVVW